MKQLLIILFLFPTLLCSQSEGGFGFRRFANTANLTATSVNNSDKNASRRAYVHSTGLYYRWNGSAWSIEETIDTFSVSGNVLSLSILNDGIPAKTVNLSSYLQTLSIDSGSITGKERFGITISGGNTVHFDVAKSIYTDNGATISGGTNVTVNSNTLNLTTNGFTQPVVRKKSNQSIGYFDRYVINNDSLDIYYISPLFGISAFGSDLGLSSTEKLQLTGDSVLISTIATTTALKFLTGTTSGNYLKRMVGTTDGDVVAWDGVSSHWEVRPKTDYNINIGNSDLTTDDNERTLTLLDDFNIIGDGSTPDFYVEMGSVAGGRLNIRDSSLIYNVDVGGTNKLTAGGSGVHISTGTSDQVTINTDKINLKDASGTVLDLELLDDTRMKVDSTNEFAIGRWPDFPGGFEYIGYNRYGLEIADNTSDGKRTTIAGMAYSRTSSSYITADRGSYQFNVKSLLSSGTAQMNTGATPTTFYNYMTHPLDIYDNVEYGFRNNWAGIPKDKTGYGYMFQGGDVTQSAPHDTASLSMWIGIPQITDTTSSAKSTLGTKAVSKVRGWGVQSLFHRDASQYAEHPFNWIKISTGSVAADTLLNGIQFYNNKYQFINSTPSPTVGDTSIMGWVGTGSVTTPIWLLKSQFGGGSGTNIYNSNGTQDDADRYFTIDSSRTFAMGQFNSFPASTWGRGFYYDPSNNDGIRILNKDGSNTSTTKVELDPFGITIHSDFSNSDATHTFSGLSESANQVLSVDRTSDTYGAISIAEVTNTNEEIVALVQNGKGTTPNVSMYLGDGYASSQYAKYTARAWGVQSHVTSGSFDWIQVLLPDTGTDTTGNNLNFYNRKYYWVNTVPSPTVGDSSVHIWVGNGTTTTPMFVPFSAITAGAPNIYNSNGTTTANTRTATILESIRFVGTADFGQQYPFQVHSTGNEPPIQLWKGNTDSVYLYQSDVEYHYGSSTVLQIESSEYLILAADSIQASTLSTKTKIQNIVGISNSGTLQQIEGSSGGQVLTWNASGYWELGSGGGAVADGDYGDITVSSSGTVWTIDAGVVSNSKLASGAGGIYKGSGTIPDNTDATITAAGDFRFLYSGGNPAFEFDDALNQVYISGQSGTYSAYADNTNVGLVAGTGTWLVGSDYALTATASVANTNTAADRLVIRTNSTGTPTVGHGGSILFQGESTTTDNRDMAYIKAVWQTAVDAIRRSNLSFGTVQNGVFTEGMKLNANFLQPTSGGSLTIGGSSDAVYLGNSSGLTAVISTGTGSVQQIAINASGNNTNTSGSIGYNNFSTTSGTKYDWRMTGGFAPTSGAGNFYNLLFNGEINQTGGANGNSGAIIFAPTLTSLGGTWSALTMATSNSSTKFLNQTGSNTTSTHVGAFGFGSTTVPTDKVEVTGNLALMTAGNKLKIATGSNASAGTTGAMTAGTITVNTTAVTANSIILLTGVETSGAGCAVCGDLSVGTITAGTSFVINSSSVTDVRAVNWLIIN